MLSLKLLNIKDMYLTDLTENEWQYMQKVLLAQERKRKHDLSKIKWRNLPFHVYP